MEVALALLIAAGVAFIVMAILGGRRALREALRDPWERAASKSHIEYIRGALGSQTSLPSAATRFRLVVTRVPPRCSRDLEERCDVRGNPCAPNGGSRLPDNTRVRLLFPSALRLRFRLTTTVDPRHKTTLLGGMPVIATGDEAFDRLVVVKSWDEAEMRVFLTPVRRKKIRLFFILFREGSSIDSAGVGCELQDAAHGPPEAFSTVKRLLRVARCLATEQTEVFTDSRLVPLSLAADGQLADTDTEPSAGESAEIESLAESSAPLGNLEATGSAEAAAPAEEATVTTAENAASAPSACASQAIAFDAQAIAAALFDPKLSTYDTRRIFEQDYRGKEIAWEGTLRAIEDFTYDFELGEGPGVKAIFEIGAIVSPLGHAEKVDAAARFRQDAKSALAARVGERVAFRGKLINVDGVARIFFVGGGTLAA